MLYCLSLALSVSCLDFCHCFLFSLSLPACLLSLNSLFPSIYDIEGGATTAVSLVSGFSLCDHGLDFLSQLI